MKCPRRLPHSLIDYLIVFSIGVVAFYLGRKAYQRFTDWFVESH